MIRGMDDGIGIEERVLLMATVFVPMETVEDRVEVFDAPIFFLVFW